MWKYNNELYHHGVKGQRWGIRRYQNPDGSLTEAGKKRLGIREERIKKNNESIRNLTKDIDKNKKDLSELSKNGSKSKVFTDRLYADTAYDPETGEPIKKKKDWYYYDDPDVSYSSKKEAISGLKRSLESEIDFGKKAINDLMRENSILASAPINSRTFLENESRGKKAFKVAATGVGITGIAASYAAGGAFGVLLGLPITAVGAISAGGKAEKVFTNLGVKKEYRKN